MLQAESVTTSSTARKCVTEAVDIHKLSKQYPLRKLHYLWLLIQATVHSYYTSQRFVLYFLFVQTSTACDFKHDFALMFMISIFCETLVIPITGYICDRLKRFNHTILVFTFLLHFASTIALYILFIGKWSNSKILVMAVNIGQTLISMQFNNSLYKLTKLYLNYDTIHTDCNEDDAPNDNNIQMTYFTRIGIWSRFAAQLSLAAITIPAFIIMKQQYWNFDDVQYFLMSFVAVFGLITLCLSLRIAAIFHGNPHIYGAKQPLVAPLDSSEIEVALSEYTGVKSWYFCESFKLLFTDNIITRYGIINVILVFLLADLLQSYEPLTIAGVNMNDDHQSLSNFCGNYVTNLMYQSCWQSLFTAIGAVLYLYVLLPFVDTFRFYRYVYPISSLLVGAAVFVISGAYGDVNETWLALSLGFLLAFFEYAHQFDDFLNLGFMNQEAVGFYQIIYAWSMNVWKIFGYLFLYLNVLNIAVAVMILILWLSSVIQSLFFSRLFSPIKK